MRVQVRERGLTAEAAEGAEGEERRGIQHKDTRAQRTQSSEKIELRFRSGSRPIPFFRALALSLALVTLPHFLYQLL